MELENAFIHTVVKVAMSVHNNVYRISLSLKKTSRLLGRSGGGCVFCVLLIACYMIQKRLSKVAT